MNTVQVAKGDPDNTVEMTRESPSESVQPEYQLTLEGDYTSSTGK